MERPFYLNRGNRVNTIFYSSPSLLTSLETGRRETTAQRDARQRARAMERSRSGTDRSSPVADRKNLGSGERSYGLGGGVGRGLGLG